MPNEPNAPLDLKALSQQRFELTRQSVSEFVKANSAAAQPQTAKYEASGKAVFAVIVIYTKLQVDLDFTTGDKLQYNGDIWGLGFPGGGISWGHGWFEIPPNQLIGNATVQVSLTPLTTEITFWKDGRYAGIFVGGGIAVASFNGGGSGSFQKN